MARRRALIQMPSVSSNSAWTNNLAQDYFKEGNLYKTSLPKDVRIMLNLSEIKSRVIQRQDAQFVHDKSETI